MRMDPESQKALLAELKTLLASSQMPVQLQIAAEVGVAQSLVSRAQNGQLRRVTDKVDRLVAYARSRVGAAGLAEIAAAALESDVGPVAKTDGSGHTEREHHVERFTRKAREGIEAYLADGYDPRLVVEQLAVLRRAQRVRRPGPAARPI